jgi:hypothetical protein
VAERQIHESFLYSVHIDAGGKKQESRWGMQRQRLVLPHASGLMRVDWPAQPYLNLAQDYFSRIS